MSFLKCIQKETKGWLSNKEYNFWSKLSLFGYLHLNYLFKVTFCYCLIQLQAYLFLLLDILHYRYFLRHAFNKLFCFLFQTAVIWNFCEVLIGILSVNSWRLVAVDCCCGDLRLGCCRGSRSAYGKILMTWSSVKEFIGKLAKKLRRYLWLSLLWQWLAVGGCFVMCGENSILNVAEFLQFPLVRVYG